VFRRVFLVLFLTLCIICKAQDHAATVGFGKYISAHGYDGVYFNTSVILNRFEYTYLTFGHSHKTYTVNTASRKVGHSAYGEGHQLYFSYSIPKNRFSLGLGLNHSKYTEFDFSEVKGDVEDYSWVVWSRNNNSPGSGGVSFTLNDFNTGFELVTQDNLKTSKNLYVNIPIYFRITKHIRIESQFKILDAMDVVHIRPQSISPHLQSIGLSYTFK
tara:strand:- start:35 stop:679 length:645 start_codon:yes stop_codon:yes gene_type:complete